MAGPWRVAQGIRRPNGGCLRCISTDRGYGNQLTSRDSYYRWSHLESVSRVDGGISCSRLLFIPSDDPISRLYTNTRSARRTSPTCFAPPIGPGAVPFGLFVHETDASGLR